jgi:RNA polymerase sigma factor for flagellar operon FliA
MNNYDLSLSFEQYYKTRSLELRNFLVMKNIRLVNKILYNIFNIKSGFSHKKDDMHSQGVLGLIEAVEKYDPHRNIKFSTFAYFYIKGRIYDGIRKETWFSNEYRKAEDKDKIRVNNLVDFNDNLCDNYKDESINQEEIVFNNYLREKLEKEIKLLSPKLQDILYKHYYEEKTHVEISKDYKVVHQRIAWLLRKARSYLKKQLIINPLSV